MEKCLVNTKYGIIRILIATAIEEGVEAFITNDIRLKNIDEINCIIINDYL